MLRRILVSLVPSLLVAFTAQAAPAPESFAPMLQPLMPAVVNISTTQKINIGTAQPFQFNLPDDPQFDQFREMFRPFNAPQALEKEVTSLGSGFVIDAGGYVVTNNHVIANASEVDVIFNDNTKLRAKVVGTDSQTDLALLKVKTDKKLAYVNFGDSDALRVGDWVVAVGNPFGLGGSVSAGIVSARGRNINAGPFDDFIQTDAAINRGNSGGPLFNANGEVVGINSAIFSPTGGNVGIGFAVPTALAKPIIEQLKKFGRTHRAWLGVKIQLVSDEVADALGMKAPRGALVLEVDGPAKGTGMEPGDVIVRFDGKDVNEMRKLPRLVADTPVGKKVEVVLWRKGREIPVQVKLGEVPATESKRARAPEAPGKTAPVVRGEAVMGMKLLPLTDNLRAQAAIPKAVQGLIVVDVDVNAEAAKRGVLEGDVIGEVNQAPVNSIADFKNELAKAKKAGRDFVLIKVQRKKGSAFITVPLS